MSTRPRTVPVDAARRIIAAAIIDPSDTIPPRLGVVTLRPHQRAAAARVEALIGRFGGALLAEPVGLGKTFIALAVAARTGRPLLIATPSALRDMWRDAIARCGLAASLVTHEFLSRATSVAGSGEGSFIIVDEAHRLRSPGAKRYAALAEICRRSPVLLITATPVQNSRADLAAQLALFVGRAAWRLNDEQLACYIVRGSPGSVRGLPRLNGPHRITLATDDDCLDDLLDLPPPVPASDERLVMALTTFGLIHQWSSSRAALVAALERRRSRAIALRSAIEAGRRPTRVELSAWTHLGDAVQLAFPELVAAESSVDDVDDTQLLAMLARHAAALDALLRRLRETPDPDEERARLLRQLRASHPGARIIAFCHYTETVNSLRARLARDPGIAALTARGARIAGGRVPRASVLAQFTPRSAGSPTPTAERIDLLITTDLSSEGLNLQEASVVVHLDLPWNPARLDQRVGRVLRLGSRHAAVHAYAVSPPASAERLLRIEQRLRDKLSIARHTVGVAGRILPSPFGVLLEAPEAGLAERAGTIEAKLRSWSNSSFVRCPPELAPSAAGRELGWRAADGADPVIAAVRSDTRGFLALVQEGSGARLVANVGGGIETSVTAIESAIDMASGPERTPADACMVRALDQLDRWLATRCGDSAVDFTAATAARSRRSALARVAQALARTPRHRRALLAPLADAARAVAVAPLGEGAERILETLVHSDLPDEAWLRSIAAFGALNVRQTPAPVAHGERPRICAVILFQAPSL